MSSDARKENNLFRLRDILKRNNVKLWQPPYHEKTNNDEKNSAKCFQDLASLYSAILNVTTEECVKLLLELQEQSLNRLEERNIFKTEGVATVRVRVPDLRTSEFSILIKLCEITDTLKERISNEVKVPVKKLKLISGGKVLKNGVVLEAQNVKHGNTVLALILQNEGDEDILSEIRDNHVLLEQTKQDLEYLNRGKTGKKYFSITNQTGSSLDLPPVDRNILVAAMTLHEKGKWAFDSGQYSLALLFFFEADAEFKKSRSDILEKVDNYGLINLDIVWTYLHLKSLHHLSDAESRLKICEDSFYRCYGVNLERLNEIKGTSGNERVLFMRLHLLQGIIFYLKNQQNEAVLMFEKVDQELKDLKVDFENVKSLRRLVHCSTKTAKLALQATFNDINVAANYILERKDEEKIIRGHERIREFADNHVCLDGSQINLTVLKQMHVMGYTHLISAHALKHCNNDISEGLLWVEDFRRKLANIYPPYVIDMFITLEFDDKGVREVLKIFSYELTDQCVEALIRLTEVGKEYFSKLLSDQAIQDYQADQSSFSALNLGINLPSLGIDLPNPGINLPSTSSGITSTQDGIDILNREFDARDRLTRGISNSEDSHLISDLDAEEKFLKLYKSFLV